MIDETMVTPPNGVYITYCIYNGIKYPSVTNVGVKPTVGTYKKNMETHIFNFNKELYGKHIKIEFLKMTRDEVKFDSVDELSAQIARDCGRPKNITGYSHIVQIMADRETVGYFYHGRTYPSLPAHIAERDHLLYTDDIWATEAKVIEYSHR